MSTVAVAMSGGVDSSLTAALLLREGYDVFGLTMRTLPGEAGEKTVAEARAAAEQLGIAHRMIDLRATFATAVTEPFIQEYRAGRTPNPCVQCNRSLKFGELWEAARDLGADFLATGHYARILGRPRRLYRGAHKAKDQSYFLYAVPLARFEQLLFPLGELEKTEVRQRAAELGLLAAQKSESQEICFVSGDYRELLGPGEPAIITDTSGRVRGRGGPIFNYTVGQRRGLGLSGGPWYVKEVRPVENRVVIAYRAELWERELRLKIENEFEPLADGRRVQARLRSSGRLAAAVLRRSGDEAWLEFDQPVGAVAPGQAAVLYQDDLVLGGGTVLGPQG